MFARILKNGSFHDVVGYVTRQFHDPKEYTPDTWRIIGSDNIFTSDYAKNFINYSSPAYDALFQQAINATDEAAQTDLYKQMETMLADTAANVYIQDLSDLVAMRQDLGGLKFYPIYVLDLSTVYLTQQ